MSIPFTQFLRPNGQKRAITIIRPALTQMMADAIIAAGGRFEIEELSTGIINMECLIDEYEIVTGKLCNNGPDVNDAVDSMILAAQFQGNHAAAGRSAGKRLRQNA